MTTGAGVAGGGVSLCLQPLADIKSAAPTKARRNQTALSILSLNFLITFESSILPPRRYGKAKVARGRMIKSLLTASLCLSL
jgi:hypothetical protein